MFVIFSKKAIADIFCDGSACEKNVSILETVFSQAEMPASI